MELKTIKRRAVFFTILLFCLNCALIGLHARDIYVDNSCSVSGNGDARGPSSGDGGQCASSPGAAGPYTDIQEAFNNVAPGDTVLIQQGTGEYITTNRGSTNWINGGYHLATSGTQANPITITTYQDDNPWIRNGTNCAQQWCDHPTFSTSGTIEYIIWDGLRIDGSLWLRDGPARSVRGTQVINCELITGWDNATGGSCGCNWAALDIEGHRGAIVRNNYIHDIVFPNDVTNNVGNDSGIKMFDDADTIIEYNTFENIARSGSKSSAIDEKARNTNTTVRYNHMINVGSCFIHAGATNDSGWSGSEFYGNLCECRQESNNSGWGNPLMGGNHADSAIYNNTFDQCKSGANFNSGSAPFNPDIYNNIWSRSVLSNTQNRPAAGYNGVMNYNVYTSGVLWERYGGNYSTLSAWQSATGNDPNSTDTMCQFVNRDGGDFNVAPGNFCETFGRVGGVSSGAQVEVGAFGVTDCVGWLCNGGGNPGGGGNTDPVGNVSNNRREGDVK